MRNQNKHVGIGLMAATAMMTLNCTSHTSESQAPAAIVNNSSATSGSKPNIIFVLTDDLSWNLINYMPAVQGLMARGMAFTQYFVTDSLCCPSRSSIFTGKYPHDTQVFTNSGPLGGYATFERVGNQNETFATTLAAAGYRAAMMGKYLNGYAPTVNSADPGWTEWDVAGDGYPEFNYQLNQNGVVNSYGSQPTDYLTDVLSGLAGNFVTAASSEPFVLEVATFAPHAPYVPAPRCVGKFHVSIPRVPTFNAPNINPPRWLATHGPLSAAAIAKLDTDFNLRVEAVQAVDDMIDALMKQLAATGLDKNTYVVFSSDNGYHMGEHQLLAGKQTAFDTDIRVPLVVVGPGVPSGVINDHIVENIDLCPTFAELAGTAAPSTSDGHSLVRLLRGEPVSDWSNVSLVEHVGPDLAPPSALGPDDDYVMAGYAAVRPKADQAGGSRARSSSTRARTRVSLTPETWSRSQPAPSLTVEKMRLGYCVRETSRMAESAMRAAATRKPSPSSTYARARVCRSNSLASSAPRLLTSGSTEPREPGSQTQI
jgi:arylsulfatase A-like enzyme